MLGIEVLMAILSWHEVGNLEKASVEWTYCSDDSES